MLAWLIAAMMWLLVVANLFRLRTPRGERGLLGASFWAAVALTLNVDAVHVRFDDATHVHNLASLVEHASDVFAVTYIGTIFSAVALGSVSGELDRHRSRRLMAVAAATVVTLTALFFGAPTGHESLHFAADYGNRPPLTAFWVITMAYLAWVAVGLLTLTGHYYRQVHRREIRVAFILVAVGSVALIPFSVAKVVVALQHVVTGWPQHLAAACSSPLMAVATLSYALGLAVPVVTSWAVRSGRRINDYVLLQALRPMWRSLVAAVPEAALGATAVGWADVLPGQAHLRLSSRVVEIRDAQLVLAGYVPSSEHAGADATAAEAAATVAALQRRGEHADVVPGATREFVEGRATMTGEARYLVEVWRHMATSTAGSSSSTMWGNALRLLGKVLSPTIVASAVSFSAGIAGAHSLLPGIGWGLAAVVVAPLAPAVAFKLTRQVTRHWHPETEAQGRVLPLAAACSVALIGLLALGVLHAPHLTTATACSMVAGLMCLMASRTWTNVSAHVSTLAGALAFAVLVFSPWWLVAGAVLVLLGRSRLAVGAHTLPQVVWAAPLGVIASSLPLVIAGY